MGSRELSLHEAVSAFKRNLVRAALAAHDGNRSRAAAALKIERTSLLRLIRELGPHALSSDHLAAEVEQLAAQHSPALHHNLWDRITRQSHGYWRLSGPAEPAWTG